MTDDTTTPRTPIIDPEFQSLIPPQTADERRDLETNLKANGCQDALVVWKDHGVLLDGHHRLTICREHGIAYTVIEQACTDREAAMAWIIRRQLARRNLSAAQRIELALRLEPTLKAEAKARQVTGGQKKGFQNSGKPVHTDAAVGKLAGVSKDTVHRVKVIKAHASPETLAKVRAGEIKINHAYKNAKPTATPKTKTTPKTTATKTSTPARVPWIQRVRDDAYQRIEKVRGRSLTEKELAARWGVKLSAAQRMVRDCVLFGAVTKDGERFTITHSACSQKHTPTTGKGTR